MTRVERASQYLETADFEARRECKSQSSAFYLADFADREAKAEVDAERKWIAARLKNICGEVGRSSVVDFLSELNRFIEELEAYGQD